tara:strand:- start:7325 stop:8011 length:687 start_codon:yes stop_codon:yes gene_type:complete
MKSIAIIPARAGSKGIPRKNVRLINGKPLIEYTLDVAVSLESVSSVWVSSDDDKVLEICKKYNDVKVHKRPDSLAGDSSKVSDTVKDVIRYEVEDFDAILLLQPTSPIRTKFQIENAIELFTKNKNFSSLVSVCGMDDTHPARMYWMEKDELKPIMPEYQHQRRQEIPLAWYRNGAIYIVRKDIFLSTNQIIVEPILGFEMPKSDLLNIDDPIDLDIANILMKDYETC